MKVSFFGVPKLLRLAPPRVAMDNGLKVASLIDRAGTKASLLQMRAEAKDYVDIDALLRLGKVGLPTALAAAQKLYGSSFNPEITLKALSYFADGDLRALPEDMKERLVVAAREVDLEHLPDINHAFTRRTRDHGFEP
ncbi:MAG: nucleotidyl transferase AbiEii/AbiGii toxin family protein [Steroidobacteraceae bacterium]